MPLSAFFYYRWPLSDCAIKQAESGSITWARLTPLMRPPSFLTHRNLRNGTRQFDGSFITLPVRAK